jgi:hypothetical protein
MAEWKRIKSDPISYHHDAWIKARLEFMMVFQALVCAKRHIEVEPSPNTKMILDTIIEQAKKSILFNEDMTNDQTGPTKS